MRPGTARNGGRPPRRRAARAAAAIGAGRAASLALLVLLALAADWRTPPPGEGPETVRVRTLDGHHYVPVNDLARMLDATKFWRADVRKLVLRAGAHTIVLTVGSPFVVVDTVTVWLGTPVRSLGGEVQVPVALVDTLPSDSTLARLTYDARRGRVVVLPPSGRVGSPRVAVLPDLTRLVFPADRAEQAVVVARSRNHFRVRFGGVFVGALPETLPAAGLLRRVRPIAAAGGSAFECRVDRLAVGYRLLHDVARQRVTLEIASRPLEGFEPFAPEDPAGERHLQVVVLDPAHGGADRGVVAGEAVEKDLTLALARRLEAELRRQGIQVALTRTDDRDVSPEARAELANRLHADLVLTLHFDGYVDPRARGATAYCPPATVARDEPLGGFDPEAEEWAGDARVAARAGRLVLLPWRDVGTRHAVRSRALAEAVLSALELRGQGPTRLRERLPFDLLGVNAPGILLECATLTAPEDRERVTQEEGLRQLAVSIAEGVAAYRRKQ
jgi:N-acetylmuramoyl-L-alanine amidase